MSKTCPRCGEPGMNEDPALNALSRRDNKTYICSPCGNAEAIYDLHLALVRENESRWLSAWQPRKEKRDECL